MKNYKQSRGWRNNNPLNIRRGEQWQGLTDTQPDPEFCRFSSMEMGYRAGAKILLTYYRVFTQKGEKFTIRNIISRWAPPNENRTEEYIRKVTLLVLGEDYCTTKFVPEMELGRPDTPQGVRHLGQLMAAMTCVECGCPPRAVNYVAIREGLGLALRLYPALADIRL